MSQDICDLFDADRLTIYILAEDKQSIVSKVKTGLNSFKDIRLPINDQSIAGFVAATGQLVNISDVYDENQMRVYSPRMHFLREVDKRTGYRSKQMLVVPIIDTQDQLLGVLQLINSRQGRPFSELEEEGAGELAQTLAIAFVQRRKPAVVIRGRYDYLIADGVVSAEQMETAQLHARERGLSLEEVLQGEMHVKTVQIGAALAKFFGVSYEPAAAERVKPVDLLRNIKRDYVDANALVAARRERRKGVVVMTPGSGKNLRQFAHGEQHVFPQGAASLYRVTTRSGSSSATVDQFFRCHFGEMGTVDDLLSGMNEASRMAQLPRAGDEAVGCCRQRTGAPGYQGSSSRPIPAGRFGYSHRTATGQGQDHGPLPQGRFAGQLHRSTGFLSLRPG